MKEGALTPFKEEQNCAQQYLCLASGPSGRRLGASTLFCGAGKDAPKKHYDSKASIHAQSLENQPDNSSTCLNEPRKTFIKKHRTMLTNTSKIIKISSKID